MDWLPFYDEVKQSVAQQRENAARRRAEWVDRSPRGLGDLYHVLKSIPSDLPYPYWFKVLAAIFHETHGSEAGRALAHLWSKRVYDRYDPEEVDAIWDG